MRAVAFLAVTLILAPLSAVAEAPLAANGPVQGGHMAVAGHARVVDGDTLEIEGVKVRLEGIDAPESDQPCLLRKPGPPEFVRCGTQATEALVAAVGGKPVVCEGGKVDFFKRLLATCYADGVDLNRWLVRNGHAVAYRKYSTRYVHAEEMSKLEKLGVWSTEFMMPWDWRKQ